MKCTKAKQKVIAAIRMIVQAAKELTETEMLYLEEQEASKHAEEETDGKS